jgi:hypothetical protein
MVLTEPSFRGRSAAGGGSGAFLSIQDPVLRYHSIPLAMGKVRNDLLSFIWDMWHHLPRELLVVL